MFSTVPWGGEPLTSPDSRSNCPKCQRHVITPPTKDPSDRDHRDACTSRQEHSTFPQTFLRESLFLRLQNGGPSPLQRLTQVNSDHDHFDQQIEQTLDC